MTSPATSLAGGVWMTSNAGVEDEGAPVEGAGLVYQAHPAGMVEGPDTRVTCSVRRTDGACVPGHNDTWHRSRDRDDPCHQA